MEHGTLEREFTVEAAPEVVYEVVSTAEHIRQWWADEADLEPVPGAVGELAWGDRAKVATLTVMAADPPRTFSFRWAQPDGAAATAGNSLLVTFTLVPAGSGTLVRFTESGHRETERYEQHRTGWDTFLPRLRDHLAGLVAAR